MSNKFDESFGFGGGDISSCNSVIEVCKIKNSDDYKTLSDWIDEQL